MSNEDYACGTDIDDCRRVDYDSRNKPIGVELLCVSKGVNLDELPRRAEIAKLLNQIKEIRVLV